MGEGLVRRMVMNIFLFVVSLIVCFFGALMYSCMNATGFWNFRRGRLLVIALSSGPGFWFAALFVWLVKGWLVKGIDKLYAWLISWARKE
jgi:hypothetical protein